ncbi:hypothetical protein [uncultured Deinococcus sp.]|uniref:hypothetical protein n=1 Tax=uncultured Deinococcus sp. TaxID=158789 RepID=UPI00258B3C53|nr:hypothetical protein [uncultured Deinococcus sp.]
MVLPEVAWEGSGGLLRPLRTIRPLTPTALYGPRTISGRTIGSDVNVRPARPAPYLFDVKDDKCTYQVLIANLPSIVTENEFDSIPAYPQIAQDYAYTFRAMEKLKFDIWLSSHASQFDLHKKHQPSDAYNPERFRDNKGYQAVLADLKKEFDKKTKKAISR